MLNFLNFQTSLASILQDRGGIRSWVIVLSYEDTDMGVPATDGDPVVVDM